MEGVGPLIVNMYGGPGSGKSTMAAYIFALLKHERYSVELVTEYAKDITYLKSINQLSNQIYIFGKQHNRLWRLADQVDIIVTDSPLLTSLAYNKDSPELEALVIAEYKRYKNLDIFLNRVKPYVKLGRTQSEKEARKLDDDIRAILRHARTAPLRLYDPFDLEVDGDIRNADKIMDKIHSIILPYEPEPDATTFFSQGIQS